MKVGFNARLLTSPDLRGWNRYTVNLVEGLTAVGVEPVLYSDRPLHPDHLRRFEACPVRPVVRVGPLRPLALWEQAWLPSACARDRVALLHAPANFGLPWSSPCPRVLTLHDAIDQAYYAPRTPRRERWRVVALRSRLAHAAARTAAERVVTVSEHARGDLIKVLGLPAEKVRAVLSASDPRFHRPVEPAARDAALRRLGVEPPYVVYVGGWEGRKNLPFLVRAFAEANPAGVSLVLAGGSPSQRGTLTDLAERLGVGHALRLLNWVEDDDLPALYAGALCLAYPSEYEGFGLQACEAMAVGCPVLAARATSLPEVLADGGETFALGDPAELAALLRRVATDPSFRDDLTRRGRARAAGLSWRRTAENTVAVYRELV